jgi:hypothetical protein
MQRRRLLVGLGAGMALTGCLGQARDESGPRRPPGSPRDGRDAAESERELVIRDADILEADDGTLRLVITVENTSGVRQSDTLVGIATVDGTDYRVSREVALDADSEAEYTLDFEVDYQAWSAKGDLSYGWDDQVG